MTSGGDHCAQLTHFRPEKATIESAIAVDGICHVSGIAHPVQGSEIRFIVYLPSPDKWNGRYYQIGNGGFAGAIHLPTLQDGANRNDVIAATDTGHRGTGFDASWAAENPVALADYGWRSIKATSDAARAIAFQYYGKAPTFRYFMGCSNGGRMALMAASRWPEEWDGIIAGAPANPWTKQLKAFEDIQAGLRTRPDALLNEQDLIFAANTAKAACPRKLLKDQIFLRPDKCVVNWSHSVCRSSSKSQCLSVPKIDAIRTLEKAGYYPASMVVSDWAQWITNKDASANSQLAFATQYRRHLFPHYSTATLTANLDIRPDSLTRFRDKGGKILSYFGLADAVIAPGLGLQWYRDVEKAAGGKNNIRSFYRMLLVPGMTHCQGGSGAVNFGQSIVAPAISRSPLHDIRSALENWVEQGNVSEGLTAQSEDGEREQIVVM